MPSLSADHHAVLTATRIELLDALFEMVFEAGWAEFVKTCNARGWECAIASDESVKAKVIAAMRADVAVQVLKDMVFETLRLRMPVARG